MVESSNQTERAIWKGSSKTVPDNADVHLLPINGEGKRYLAFLREAPSEREVDRAVQDQAYLAWPPFPRNNQSFVDRKNGDRCHLLGVVWFPEGGEWCYLYFSFTAPHDVLYLSEMAGFTQQFAPAQ